MVRRCAALLLFHQQRAFRRVHAPNVLRGGTCNLLGGPSHVLRPILPPLGVYESSLSSSTAAQGRPEDGTQDKIIFLVSGVDARFTRFMAAAAGPCVPEAFGTGLRLFTTRKSSPAEGAKAQKQKGVTEPEGNESRHHRQEQTAHDGEGTDIPLSALNFRFCRSSKPGGQSANKSETKAVLTVSAHSLSKYISSDLVQKVYEEYGHLINKKGELVISSEKHSSQVDNKKECLNRLTDLFQQLRDKPEVTGGKDPREFKSEEAQLKYKAKLIASKKKDQYNRKCERISRRDF